MSEQTSKPPIKTLALVFAAGAVAGGVVGAGAGAFWVQANAENPEVVAEIEADEQLQDDFEAYLEALAEQPPEGSGE